MTLAPTGSSNPGIKAAWRIIHVGDRKAIVEMRAQCREGSAEAKMCSAGISLRDGNPAEALRILRRLLPAIPRFDRGLVVDLLAAQLSGRMEVAEAEWVLDSCEPSTRAESALFNSTRAVLFAMLGNSEESRHAAKLANELVEAAEDENLQGVVLFRLGRAAVFRGEGAEALDLVLRSARLALTAGFTRLAGVAYGTAHDAATLLADFDLIQLYSAKSAEFGRLSDDLPMTIYGLACQMGTAADAGDELALRALTEEYQGYCAPRQYSEGITIALATALPLGWCGDFAGFETAVKQLPEYPNPVVIALQLALLSVCAFARSDVSTARSLSRQVLHKTGPGQASPAFDRYRRLSRTLAAFVCICVGDIHRGERVLASKDLAATSESTIVDPRRVVKTLAGYSKLLEAAGCYNAPKHVELTPSQTALIRRFAVGMSIPEIARATGRSPATLRAQAHQINVRLGVKGRARAVARARELRIV